MAVYFAYAVGLAAGIIVGAHSHHAVLTFLATYGVTN